MAATIYYRQMGPDGRTIQFGVIDPSAVIGWRNYPDPGTTPMYDEDPNWAILMLSSGKEIIVDQDCANEIDDWKDEHE